MTNTRPTSIAGVHWPPPGRTQRWRPPWLVLLWVAAIVVAGVAWTTGQAGAVEGRCSTVRLPVGADRQITVGRESVSGDGWLVAYETWGTPAQPGPPISPRAVLLDTSTGGITVLSELAHGRPGPLLSSDGSTVALRGAGVRLYHVATGNYTQVAPGADGEVGTRPQSVSADGTRVLYTVETDNDDNTDGPYAVRVVDSSTGSTQQVLADVGRWGALTGMAISPDGHWVAFSSQGDLTGGNADNNAEIFVYDLTSSTLVQATQSTGSLGTQDPYFVGNPPSQVVFSSDMIEPSPPNAGLPLVSYDLATGSVAAVDELGDYGDVLSADGSTVVYTASRNPAGTNPDHSDELFVFDRESGTKAQLTATGPPWGAQPVAIASTGSAVVMASDANLNGANPDHDTRYYLVRTCAPAPRPDARVAVAPAGAEVGNDVYSSRPAANQQRTATVSHGATRTYTARLQNDRAATDNLSVRGVDTGASGYVVTYWRGGTDITAAVRAGSYRTGPLAPGRSATVTIAVTAFTAAAGSTHTVDLTATSRTNPVARDVVRAKVARA